MDSMSDYFSVVSGAVSEQAFGIKFWADFASGAVAAIAGAGFGAWIGARSAFNLERRKAHHDRILAEERARVALNEQHAAAGNLAMLSLALIYNDLITFDAQALAQAKKSAAPWFYLAAMDIRPSNYHTFDIPSLAFLLQSSKPDIVAKLALEADRYQALLKVIQTRSTYHQEHVLDAIDGLKAIDPRKNHYSAEELRAAVSVRVFNTLDNYTSDIYTLWELGMKTCKETSDELRALLKEMLPDHKIIGFDIAAEVARQGSPIMKARDESSRARQKPPG
jgi:hypothetical protein